MKKSIISGLCIAATIMMLLPGCSEKILQIKTNLKL